jgi:hypothetical protein
MDGFATIRRCDLWAVGTEHDFRAGYGGTLARARKQSNRNINECRAVYVLVQREMESGRSPLVSIARTSADPVTRTNATATGKL